MSGCFGFAYFNERPRGSDRVFGAINLPFVYIDQVESVGIDSCLNEISKEKMRRQTRQRISPSEISTFQVNLNDKQKSDNDAKCA